MLDLLKLVEDVFSFKDDQTSNYSSSIKFTGEDLVIDYSISDPEHLYIDEDGHPTDAFEEFIGNALKQHASVIELFDKCFNISGGIFIKFTFGTRHFLYSYERDSESKFELVGEGNAPDLEDVKESVSTCSDSEKLKHTSFTQNCTLDGTENEWWKGDPYAGSPQNNQCFSDRLRERLVEEHSDYESHCHVNADEWLSAIVSTAESEEDYVVKYDNAGIPVFIELSLEDIAEDFYPDSDDADYLLENEKELLDDFADLICSNLGFKKAEYFPVSRHDELLGDLKSIAFKLYF